MRAKPDPHRTAKPAIEPTPEPVASEASPPQATAADILAEFAARYGMDADQAVATWMEQMAQIQLTLALAGTPAGPLVAWGQRWKAFSSNDATLGRATPRFFAGGGDATASAGWNSARMEDLRGPAPLGRLPMAIYPFDNGAEASGALRAMGPPLQHLAAFHSRVESAAVLMSCAFAAASVDDFKPSAGKSKLRSRDDTGQWFTVIVDSALDRFREVRNALVHSWSPTVQADHLADQAFLILADMTPAREQLLEIHKIDRPRACAELARLLDPIADEVAATARLLVVTKDDARDVDAPHPTPAPTAQEDLQAEILIKAGGVWSLSHAAEVLGITRQALHKRIVKGGVLGVMHGRTLAVPRCQFEQIGVKTRPLSGLSRIVSLFREAKAGDWSALQFLVEVDPNLAATPISVLSSGKTMVVESAARAYLSLDEG